jgi:hypothetical protein
MRLTDLSYAAGKLAYRSRHGTETEEVLPSYLDEAMRIVEAASAETYEIPESPLNADFEALRWFPLPSEISRELRG